MNTSCKSEKILNVENFRKDGFSHICDVDSTHIGNWRYKNINKSLMFDNHNSWVYFITLDNVIVKVGETGNPLGIPEYWIQGSFETQPKTGSKARLGRLRTGDGTDSYIREQLAGYIRKGHLVSVWAKKCQIKVLTESICGVDWHVSTQIHKSLEIAYLTYFTKKIGKLPLLNKARK